MTPSVHFFGATVRDVKCPDATLMEEVNTGGGFLISRPELRSGLSNSTPGNLN